MLVGRGVGPSVPITYLWLLSPSARIAPAMLTELPVVLCSSIQSPSARVSLVLTPGPWVWTSLMNTPL
jgi:hypothetical protein